MATPKDGGDFHNDRIQSKSCTEEQRERIQEVLEYFPELEDVDLNYRWDPDMKPLASYNPLTLTITFRKALPDYQTLGHELMHAVQHQNHDLPATDRATDLFLLARGEVFTDDPSAYLDITGKSEIARHGDWSVYDRIRPHLHRLAKEALDERARGNRRYLQWFERQIKNEG